MLLDKYGGKTTIQQHETSTLHLEIQDLFTKALRSSNRHFQDEVAIVKRLEGDLRKHGDYIWYVILYFLWYEVFLSRIDLTFGNYITALISCAHVKY